MLKRGRIKFLVYILALLMVGIVLVTSQGQLGLPSQAVTACNAMSWDTEDGIKYTRCEPSEQQCNSYCQIGDENSIIFNTCTDKCGEKSVLSIAITSPNGGEIWKAGSKQTIQWTSKNLDNNQKLDVIRLRSSKGGETNLLLGTLNDGSEQIVVPSLPDGSYTLEIKSYSSGGELIFDSSDRAFSIVSSAVCGNGICEKGEADDCLVIQCIRAPCPQPPCTKGTCPQDCQKQKDDVTCVFQGSTTQQKCYTAIDPVGSSIGYECEGIEACSVIVQGNYGEKVTWKSSCGGYAYTTIDGVGEKAEFNCNQQECTDSDGGKDYFVKGTVSANGQEATDFCYNYDKGYGPCEGKGGCVLAEHSCNKDGTPGKEKYDCPNGCKDGACLQQCPPRVIITKSQRFYDLPPLGDISNSGLTSQEQDRLLYLRKSAIGDNYDSQDPKETVVWAEYEALVAKMRCIPQPACTDSDDGKNYFVKGILNTNYPGWIPDVPDTCAVEIEPGNHAHVDSCEGTNCYIIELYCDSASNPQRDIVTCENGCKDGACTSEVKCSELGKEDCLNNKRCTILKGGWWNVFRKRFICIERCEVLSMEECPSYPHCIPISDKYGQRCAQRHPDQHFKSASWTCYDGYSDEAVSQDSCITENGFKRYAKKSCSGRCNPDGSKCGVNSFALNEPCDYPYSVCGDGICDVNECGEDSDKYPTCPVYCPQDCQKPSIALNVRGRLLDKETKTPLQGVTVYTTSINSKSENPIYTDSNGNFEYTYTTKPTLMHVLPSCNDQFLILFEAQKTGEYQASYDDKECHYTRRIFLSENGVLNLGDIYVTPTAPFSLYSDVLVSFEITNRLNPDCEFLFGGGNGNYKNLHYLSLAAVPGYYAKLQVQTKDGLISNAETIIPEGYGCNVITASYINGQFGFDVCRNQVCAEGEKETCPQDCKQKGIEVSVPTSFTLSQGQSAVVVNYKNMVITLNEIRIPIGGIPRPRSPGVEEQHIPPPPQPSVLITVLEKVTPCEGECPEPGPQRDYTITSGQSIDDSGLRITFNDLVVANEKLEGPVVASFSIVQPPVCTDSDGGKNLFVKGIAESSSGPYYKITVTDYCLDEFNLNEALCNEDGTIFTYAYGCYSGCKNGACIKSPQEQTFRNAEWTCADGYAETQGEPTSCKTTDTWLAYAGKSCSGRCNADGSRCGISYFSITTPCDSEDYIILDVKKG